MTTLVGDLPLGVVIPTFALLFAFLLETILPIERRPLRRAQGILFQFGTLPLATVAAWPLGLLWDAHGLQMLPPLESWAGVWSLPIAIVLADFLTYWEHRFEHRFFWRVHKVHHSPDDIHAANTFGHPLQIIPTTLLIAFPLSFLNARGIPLWAAIAYSFWILFIHAPIKFNLSKLRWLLVDNHSHRIHHSIEPEHFDKNFANVFSVWDRLFGTEHKLRPGEWPKVGIDEPPPANLVDFLLMPLRPNPERPAIEITPACPLRPLR